MDNDANKTLIDNIVTEYRSENQINAYREDKEFEGYAKDGMYDINDYCGEKIDYVKDLKARTLLKNYMLYADHKRLAEFKKLYIGEYDELQRQYYIASRI